MSPLYGFLIRTISSRPRSRDRLPRHVSPLARSAPNGEYCSLSSTSQGAGHEVGEAALCLFAVVQIDLGHERRDRPMPAVRPDLVEVEAGFLPELPGLGDARVPQRVTPDVQADTLTEFATERGTATNSAALSGR